MTQSEKSIATFQTRVRQLILRFQELKKENEELYDMVSRNEEAIKSLEAKLKQSERNYDTLKMAKMLEVSGDDIQGAKDRLAKLIREVNKCISMLSGKE